MRYRNFPQLLLAVFFVGVVTTVANAQESLPELVRQVKPAVVSVTTYDAKDDSLISGSGFFIRPGQVMTNLHVVRGAVRAEIKTLEGKGRSYAVSGLLAVDEEADLALLSIDLPLEKSRVAIMGTSLPEEGEKVFAIGNPLRLEGSVSDGIVSAVRDVPNLGNIIQVTVPISHGNSGSPLFNMKGQVVGIVTVKVTNGQNINLALSSARIVTLLPGNLSTFAELANKTRSPLQADALADVWYRNGLDSLWLGNYESALSYFENAVNKNPRRAEAWVEVGFCKVKQGRHQEAIRAYQRALQLGPGSAEAHNRLGDAYFDSGRFEDAIASYRQAVRLRPDMAEAYYNLGMTYLELGDRASALAQSSKLASVDPAWNKKLQSELAK
ncbi:MAG: serine protease Do [Blastocatellia bacterium]|jgi:tetratricopeptide (TPR) repeat protein|nr:serine protease Do [Blastocatellia bacterium]